MKNLISKNKCLTMIVLWTSGNFIAPPLVAARTVNKLDLADDKRFEEENYGDY